MVPELRAMISKKVSAMSYSLLNGLWKHAPDERESRQKDARVWLTMTSP